MPVPEKLCPYVTVCLFQAIIADESIHPLLNSEISTTRFIAVRIQNWKLLMYSTKGSISKTIARIRFLFGIQTSINVGAG